MALPQPSLQARCSAGLSFLTDEALFDATGVRVGFTRRAGGVSDAPFDALNLGSHVGDCPQAVSANRERLQDAVGLKGAQLVTLNQVHGDTVLSLDAPDSRSLNVLRARALEGADGIAVSVTDVMALLCFADCTPVIVVAPTGTFAVAHAGWRGALAGIPAKAVEAVCALDGAHGCKVRPSECNAYIGPHIMAECYECGEELVGRFAERYGDGCAHGGDHLDLEAAVRASLGEAGVLPERIAATRECTACHPDLYFSYRASGGRCGRHGAFAGRKE